MKRVLKVWRSLLAVAIVAAAVTAVGLTVAPVQAASPAPKTLPPATNPFKSNANDVVCIAFPIVKNDKLAPKTSRCPDGQIDNTKEGGAILVYLILILQLLSLLIGAIILLFIVIGGLQYILSAGDPTRVKDAKKRLVNAVTALVLYMMMYAILNFLVPGGILQ